MTQEDYRHPIAPPPELVQQWYNQADKLNEPFITYIANRAAQWGADQELEACCDHIHTFHGKHRADWLRDMRRPHPPSLKEQALEQLSSVEIDLRRHGIINTDYIRRALEQLDD